MDFSTYKFRCSGLKNLMVKAKKKDEILSVTTKSYLEELWIKEVCGREKYDKTNKYTIKGVMVESDAMELVSKVTGRAVFKNSERLENDFITGTPDIRLRNEKEIEDTKCSWDIWTFIKATEKSARDDYFYQMTGYMWLDDGVRATLDYCLVNTPEKLIMDELYKLSFNFGESPEFQEKARRNYIFDDIPDEQRLKRFSFDRDDLAIEDLKSQIIASREYMSGLSL